MRNILLLFAILFPLEALGQYASVNGNCNGGATTAALSGMQSTNYLQGQIQSCTVTVYLTGTTNLATIYPTATGGTLGNPFTASTSGQFLFYAATGAGYDVVGSGGNNNPSCTTAQICYPSPTILLVDVFAGSSGGGGGGSPGAPGSSYQFNNNVGGFGGSAAAIFTPASGSTPANSTFASLNWEQNLASLSGANKYDTFVEAQNAIPQLGYLITDPTQAAGNPSNSSAAPIGTYEDFLNLNGLGCQEQTYSWLRDYGGPCEYRYENAQDSLSSVLDFNKGGHAFFYGSIGGGLYNYNGSTGGKSNRAGIVVDMGVNTVAQNWGVWSIMAGWTGGEVVNFNCTNQNLAGGFLGNGQVDDGCLFGQVQQPPAGSADGNGALWAATSGTVSGTTIPFVSVTNLGGSLAEQRIVRDLASAVTVTVTSVSGSNPVTINFSGSPTIPNCSSNPHSTWNSLSTAGPMLTTNLAISFLRTDGYDTTVPITTCNANSVTVNLLFEAIGAASGWPSNWPQTGTFTIYGAAWPTAVNQAAQTISTGDASGIGNNHSVDQVLAYNQQQVFISGQMLRHIGASNQGGFLEGINTGSSSDPYPKFALDWEGLVTAVIVNNPEVNGGAAYMLLGTGSSASVSSFGTLAFAYDGTPGSLGGTQNVFRYNDYNGSTSTVQTMMAYDRTTTDAGAGLNFYSHFYLNPYTNSGNGSLGIGVVAPSNGWLSVGSVFNVCLYGVVVQGSCGAVPSTAGYIGISSNDTGGLQVAEQANQTNGFDLFNVVGYNSGSLTKYFEIADNGSGQALTAGFNRGIVASFFNAAQSLTASVSGATGLGTFTNIIDSSIAAVSGNYCVQVNTSGQLSNTGSACGAGGGGSNAWSALTAPTTSLAITMPAGDTTAFTWAAQSSPSTSDWIFTAGADTGSSTTAIYSFIDTTANARTGPLFNINTVGTSTALPLQVTAQGTSNGIQMSTAGSLGVIGSGAIIATVAPAGTLTGTVLASNVLTSSLTTVGTIATGVWHGTSVGAQYGGTGLNTSASTGCPSISSGTWSVGACASLSGTGTTNYYALWTGVSSLGTGHLDDGVTTASVITSSEQLNVNTGAGSSKITVGVNGSNAGTVTMANNGASADTVWGSAATTSNTILGFATAPTTTDILQCVTSGTVCTLTDSGIGAGQVVTLTGTQTLSNKAFVAPALGTPVSGVMTNVTGLPLASGVTGTLPTANGGLGANESSSTGVPVFATGVVTVETATIAVGGTNATSAAAGTIPNATSGTASSWTATPTLGASGTLGSLTFGNATSGLVTVQTATGAITSYTIDLPVAQPTSGNTYLSCTAASPAVCTWAAGGGGGGTPCTTTGSSLQYDNAGAFGCISNFTSAGANIAALASGILDLHSATGTGAFLLPEATTQAGTGGLNYNATSGNYQGAAVDTSATSIIPQMVYNTASSSSTGNLGATSMVATTGAQHQYLFGGTFSLTVAGTSCTGSTTVTLNAIFTDPNASGSQTVPVGTVTLANAGVGVVGFAAGVPALTILAKTGTAVQYSTTSYTLGTGCTSTNPTYVFTPLLLQVS